MIGRLARSRSPFFRVFADNVHRRVERVDVDGADLAYVADLRAQLKGGVDGALGMVLGRPEFDVRLVNHEWLTVLAAERRHDDRRPCDQLAETQLALKDRRGAGHSVGGEQGGEYAVAGGVGKGASLPHAQFAGARLSESRVAHAGDADGVGGFHRVEAHQFARREARRDGAIGDVIEAVFA